MYRNALSQPSFPSMGDELRGPFVYLSHLDTIRLRGKLFSGADPPSNIVISIPHSIPQGVEVPAGIASFSSSLGFE